MDCNVVAVLVCDWVSIDGTSGGTNTLGCTIDACSDGTDTVRVNDLTWLSRLVLTGITVTSACTSLIACDT